MTDNDSEGVSDDTPDDTLYELTLEDVLYFMGFMMDSQRRIYDVLLANLAAQGYNDKAHELQQMHERGQFLFPPPGQDDDEDK